MGFIKAFSGAVSSTLADQWQDFYVPRDDVSSTAVLFGAVLKNQNNSFKTNEKYSESIISDGSKIVVPEGTALITVQDGAITGFVSEPGGFIYKSNDPNSQSVFAGDGISQLFKQTWEKVKFGGIPAAEQLVFYINLKEIQGLKFGTQEPIYWYDEFLETKAGAFARGTYSVTLVNPLLFVKQYIPITYLQKGAPAFDLDDTNDTDDTKKENKVVEQLHNEFRTCLTGAFKRCSLASKDSGLEILDYIQANQDKFAQTMDEEVENTYNWSTGKGLKINNVSIEINYDEKTQEVLDEIRKQDTEIRKARRMGQVYSNNMAGMVASDTGRAMNAAASNEHGAMMGFMGLNMAQTTGSNMLNTVGNMPQQPVQQPVQQPAPTPANEETVSTEQNPTAKILEMKKLLDAGAITQEEFDKIKNELLGL